MDDHAAVDEIREQLLDLDIDVITLYRYFAYAAAMRDLYAREFDPGWVETMTPDAMGVAAFLYSRPGMYLLYSYAGIYLVIEGWRDLGLHDERIDEMLESPFVDRLRLFRNATFHYQKEPLSPKHLQFFGTEEENTEVWLNGLYREFERFFAENTLPLPTELKADIEGKPHSHVAGTIRDYLGGMQAE